ncbi:MAG TPA: hypothetical protein DCE42_06365 [Myxococcales bacterium]|nr:hypothetical protein [Deltaproteobacteria bacterium]MBU51840.1 hypothetical protein [Deltaproteobacteria bacterium]HAA54359.1 hypothetical protein [Myxococcales bacterium]|tara:strand:+ start:5525 stop:7027 length:1503 start_codon:yes stop_codon:yes gene_type:complete
MYTIHNTSPNRQQFDRLISISIFALALILLTACGPTTPKEQTNEKTLDGGLIQEAKSIEIAPEPTPEPTPSEKEPIEETKTCALAQPPTKLTISEGGRIQIPLDTQPAGGVVRVKELPDNWRAAYQPEQSRWIVRPAYGIEGNHSFTIEVECNGTKTSYTQDVEVTALTWKSYGNWVAGKNQTPKEREHPKLWINDSDPDGLWMFGGFLFDPQQFTPTHDLWRFDLETKTWEQITPSNASPKILTGTSASLPGSSKSFHYGGGLESMRGPMNTKMFIFDSKTKTWSEDTETYDKNASMLLRMHYDEKGKRFVTACGIKGSSLHCNAATYTPDAPEGKRWKDITPAQSGPSGRYGYFSMFDQENQRLIIFSGGGQPSAQNPVGADSETWSLDLAQDPPVWKKLLPKGIAPFGRRNGCGGYDPIGNRYFLFGGTSDARTSAKGFFVLHLDKGQERWEQIQTKQIPLLRSSCTSTYDPKRKQLLFGFGNNEFGVFSDVNALPL